MQQRFLDSPDSLPFPFTISHYHVFSNGVAKDSFKEQRLDSPESWDMLRNSDPLFTIPTSREEWVNVSELLVRKDGQDAQLKVRGREIAELLNRKGMTSLFSVGSGGAGLEYHILKNFPNLRAICSEYAPETVKLLRNVFTEAEKVIEFDIRTKDWSVVTGREDVATTVCLMYRLDAQFTDKEWVEIFLNLARAGVQQVLYIPTSFLTVRNLLARIRTRLQWRFAGKAMVFSGHLRTKTTFHSYWKRNFVQEECVVGGMTAFWLTLKR